MNKKDTVINIKITFLNGYSIETFTGKNFGEACLAAYKYHAKLLNAPIGFELINDTVYSETNQNSLS